VVRKLPFLSVLVFTLLASMAAASGAHYVLRSTADNVVLVPSVLFHPTLNCEEARSYLERQGYRVLKRVRCGGNYNLFRTERRGFYYTMRVMTKRGQNMIDERIR
jgi:CRISPR/Cas system-associated protein Csm6